MSGKSPPIPSPMTSEREELMRKRAAAGEQIAQAADQGGVTDSIQRRHASQNKNGFSSNARKVHKTGPTKDAKFDDDGDAIITETDAVLWQNYFATSPGSRAARSAMDDLLARRGKR